MKSLLPILIRLKTENDDNFVCSTWIRNQYASLPYNFMTWNVFKDNKCQEIEEIFTVSQTLIACLSDDPETILGFLTYSTLNSQFIIHYAYVKQAYRKNKIMTDLLETAIPKYEQELLVCSNINQSYPYLKKHLQLTYNPYVVKLLKEINE